MLLLLQYKLTFNFVPTINPPPRGNRLVRDCNWPRELNLIYQFPSHPANLFTGIYSPRHPTRRRELFLCGYSKGSDIPNDKSNVFRADLFSLFPNVKQVELWTSSSYPLNLLSLLSVLDEADIPPSFQTLRIKGQGWIKRAYAAVPNVSEQFAAKNFVIKMETIKNEDWIVIEPLW